MPRWQARWPAALQWRHLLLRALLRPAAAWPQTLAPPPQASACAACHGPQGKPSLALVPALAGQTARDTELQLHNFQAGRRSHHLVSPVAGELTRAEMCALGTWFAPQVRRPQPFQPDAAKARLGKTRADEALCTTCHLGGFAGQHEIPPVAGQPFDAVVAQLRAFKAGTRSKDGANLRALARLLSEADVENIAHDIVGL